MLVKTVLSRGALLGFVAPPCVFLSERCLHLVFSVDDGGGFDGARLGEEVDDGGLGIYLLWRGDFSQGKGKVERLWGKANVWLDL